MTTSGINFSNAECWQVQPTQVDDVWWQLEPLLQKYIKEINGELNVEDIKRLLLSGLFQCFAFHTAGDIKLAAITELIQYPQMKAVRIVGIGGENPLIAFKFFKDFEDWGRANGAKVLETWATPRTEKLDIRLGMKPLYRLMRKDL